MHVQNLYVVSLQVWQFQKCQVSVKYKSRLASHRPWWCLCAEGCAGRTHSILGVEDVRRRGIVQDEGAVQVTAQAAQVLDVETLMEDAGLPEEARAKDSASVQQVGHWVCVLGGGGGRVQAGK